MAKPCAAAASAASSVFSMTPRASSWRPRWAIGRRMSQSGAFGAMSADLEDRLDLGQGVERQMRDADGGARMASAFAEDRDDEVGGAVHRLRQRVVAAGHIEEAAEPLDAPDRIEIAEGGPSLGDEIDRAEPGGGARRGGICAG